MLARAADANLKAMNEAGGYKAMVETEKSMLSRREGRMEAATLLEQSSGTAQWTNAGGFVYHIVGSRSYSGAVPLSKLAFLRTGWIAPTTSGTRFILVTQTGAGETKLSETLSGALAPEIIVHPLAQDRDTYYNFAGGEQAKRKIDITEKDVLVVMVTPRTDFKGEQTVFEGELDLDPQSLRVVRMFGRLKILGRPPRGGMLHLPDFEPKITLVELVNQPLSNGDWVPLVQRFEIQSPSGRETGSGAARRVISRFRRVDPITGGRTEIGSSTLGYAVTRARSDTLHHFKGWYTAPGTMTESVDEADFGPYRPTRLSPTGKPLFLIQGFETKDFVRVNRIEGYFTGISLITRLRDAAPGIYAQARGGYAWKEKTWRGGGRLGWESNKWTLEASGGKNLDVTNKFRNQFDSRALSALVGRDAWDYVGRTEGGLGITRRLKAHGSIFTIEGARVKDDSVERNMTKSLFAKGFRPNRGVAEGTYWRGRALLDWNPEISPLYVKDGIGFRGEFEYGNGDLDYKRIEARVVMRKNFSRMFFITRLHAGAVFSDAPPPQQLFELGGPAGLPGYEYKEFAGDRAVLFRTRLTFPLGLFDLPWRVNPRLTLPALAPAFSIGFQGGYTDTRNAAGDAAVLGLGKRYDYKTGDLITDPNTGQPLPASVVTDKLKTSVDIRIGFFGDALAVGFARALEKGRKTKFLFAFGRQF